MGIVSFHETRRIIYTNTEVSTVCERYALLPNDKKQMIAGELDRSAREIERKISVRLYNRQICQGMPWCYQR